MTRERLYLDTMQEVFSQTSKVLVTGQQGQNNLLYLPLDKMIDGRNAAPATGPVLPPVVAAPALPTWGRGSSTICASKTRVRGRAADGQQVFDRSDRRCRRRHRPVEQRLRSPADRARGHVALRPVVESDVKPGLHFKIPYVNQVRKFDARLLTLDAPTQRFLTLERKR